MTILQVLQRQLQEEHSNIFSINTFLFKPQLICFNRIRMAHKSIKPLSYLIRKCGFIFNTISMKTKPPFNHIFTLVSILSMWGHFMQFNRIFFMAYLFFQVLNYMHCECTFCTIKRASPDNRFLLDRIKCNHACRLFRV